MDNIIKIIFIIFVLIQCRVYPQAGIDTFGITQFYSTKNGTREWNSLHWANGIDRTIKYEPDPYDPTDWTEDHSGSTDGFHIDGNGIMSMSGGGPRFHINSLRDEKVPAQFFLNTEFTAYYRRIGLSGENWGGMVVGARSGPLGHASPGGDNCDATTYYARFRNDGNWDFEKELKHPDSEYWSDGGIHTHGVLWGGNPLPENRWIGMKYLAYNINNNTEVKLEVWIDSVSDGNPVDGGQWEKVGEVVDNGNWNVGTVDIVGCSYSDPATIITEGNGTLLMRTDGDRADYKMVTIREIDVSGNTESIMPERYICKTPEDRNMKFKIFDFRGRYLGKTVVPSEGFLKDDISPGVYLIKGNSIQKILKTEMF